MKKKNIFLVSVLLIVILLIANYQKIYKSVVPPIPEIVRSESDGSSSTLFNASMKVFGQLINKGGDGYVVIKANVRQERQNFSKTKQIYISASETIDFEFIFDEVKLFKKAPTYNVQTYALGNFLN